MYGVGIGTKNEKKKAELKRKIKKKYDDEFQFFKKCNIV